MHFDSNDRESRKNGVQTNDEIARNDGVAEHHDKANAHESFSDSSAASSRSENLATFCAADTSEGSDWETEPEVDQTAADVLEKSFTDAAAILAAEDDNMEQADTAPDNSNHTHLDNCYVSQDPLPEFGGKTAPGKLAKLLVKLQKFLVFPDQDL